MTKLPVWVPHVDKDCPVCAFITAARKGGRQKKAKVHSGICVVGGGEDDATVTSQSAIGIDKATFLLQCTPSHACTVPLTPERKREIYIFAKCFVVSVSLFLTRQSSHLAVSRCFALVALGNG